MLFWIDHWHWHRYELIFFAILYLFFCFVCFVVYYNLYMKFEWIVFYVGVDWDVGVVEVGVDVGKFLVF